MIQRSTRLATFDLLLPRGQVSLKERMETAGHSATVAATIVELQLLSLESSLHKPEALAVIPLILDDLLLVYSGIQYPIRRAR